MTTIQTANSHTITQEQINAIIQKRFDEVAGWQKLNAMADRFDKLKSDIQAGYDEALKN